jgi:hypothetical protein
MTANDEEHTGFFLSIELAQGQNQMRVIGGYDSGDIRSVT